MGGGEEAGEGGEVGVDELRKKRFLWGVGLAWAPWIPTLIGIGYAFRGISEQKAIGLGAVAGGFAESFLLFGMAATVLCEVGALFLLFRAFSSGHGLRTALSVLSISMSVLMILLFCLSLWLFWFESHHKYIGVR